MSAPHAPVSGRAEKWAKAGPIRVRRHRDESGYSLIEIVVVLGLLAIVMLPLASVFYGTEKAESYNREYGDAIAIANGQLAQAAGVTYDNLGFYVSQSPPSSFKGQPTVILGTSAPNGTAAQIPLTSPTQQVGAIVYTPSNYVVWVTGSGGQGCAYKQVYAVVSWKEAGSTVSVTQTTLVYPGGLGSYTGSHCINYVVSTTAGLTTALLTSVTWPAGVSPGMDVAGPNIAAGTTVAAVSTTPSPTLTLSQAATGTGPQTLIFGSGSTGSDITPDNVVGLAATVPSDSSGEYTVNLTWSAPADTPGYFVAVWAPDPGGQGHLAVPDTAGTSAAWAPTGSTTSSSILATATSTSVAALSPNTAYWFEIIAFSSSGDQWAISQTWVTATTQNNPALACTPGTLSISQAGQQSGHATVATSNSHLIQPITLVVTYAGPCTNGTDGLSVKATSTSGADPGSPYTLTWGSIEYTYNPPTGLCPSAGFLTGTHTYTVYYKGVATSLTAQVSFSQDPTNPPQC